MFSVKRRPASCAKKNRVADSAGGGENCTENRSARTPRGERTLRSLRRTDIATINSCWTNYGDTEPRIARHGGGDGGRHRDQSATGVSGPSLQYCYIPEPPVAPHPSPDPRVHRSTFRRGRDNNAVVNIVRDVRGRACVRRGYTVVVYGGRRHHRRYRLPSSSRSSAARTRQRERSFVPTIAALSPAFSLSPSHSLTHSLTLVYSVPL